jgi:hypothetical protein
MYLLSDTPRGKIYPCILKAYSLTLNVWRFNLSFSWVSILFLNIWRVSVVPYYVITHPPAIQKQHWHSREAQIEPPLSKCEWAFSIQMIVIFIFAPANFLSSMWECWCHSDWFLQYAVVSLWFHMWEECFQFDSTKHHWFSLSILIFSCSKTLDHLMLPQLAVDQGEQFRTNKASGDSMDKWLHFYKK